VLQFKPTVYAGKIEKSQNKTDLLESTKLLFTFQLIVVVVVVVVVLLLIILLLLFLLLSLLLS